MPRCGATTNEKVGGACVSADTRAASFCSDQIFRVAAGTAPPTFSRLFSEEFSHARGGAKLDEKGVAADRRLWRSAASRLGPANCRWACSKSAGPGYAVLF